MQTKEIINAINTLINEGNKLIGTKWWNGATFCVKKALYEKWHLEIKVLLTKVLSEENEFLREIFKYKNNYLNNVEAVIEILKSILKYEERGLFKFKNLNDENSIEFANYNNENKIDLIFSKFHNIAKQLTFRRCNRETLTITDEYDVQDLLHSLLLLFYDDVRTEEWTPSYAGKSSRQDFLIKKEKIVIETKMTRDGLTDRELGDQLIIDIDRYKKHLDCNQLYFFIYDPMGKFRNPKGFITDLEEKHNGFVKIYINPQW